MGRIEVFGTDLFIGFAVIGALISLVLWLFVLARIRPALSSRLGVLHTATVLLSTASFIGIDLVLLWNFAYHPTPQPFRIVVAFVFGIQAVAAASATLFLRRHREKAR